MAGRNHQKRQMASQEAQRRALQSNKLPPLPFEIRLMIAELVTQQEEREQETRPRPVKVHQQVQRTTRLLQLVATGAEWQTIIEKETFASLKLRSVADILHLGQIVDRRRERCIKKIRLHVELADYDDDECELEEDQDTMRLNNRIFSQHLIPLLSIISQWKDSSGLTLDLSAASRSDSLHSFSKLYSDVDLTFFAVNDVSLEERKRTLGNLLDLSSQDSDKVILPSVPAVAKFILTRRHFRSFSPETVRVVLGCFPNLEQVAYEPYAGVDEDTQSARDAANTALLKELPKSTRTVSLWEYDRHPLNDEPTKKLDHDLVLAAANASHRLESLCVTFALEAHDFFDVQLPTDLAPWRNLHTLSLTSSWLTMADSALVNRVLLAAGEKAKLMPKLQIMELWHHKRETSVGGTGCFLFRYEAGDGLATALVFRTAGTSDFIPAKEVTEAWDAVAKGGLEFDVIDIPLAYAYLEQYPMDGSLEGVLRQDLGGIRHAMGHWDADM